MKKSVKKEFTSEAKALEKKIKPYLHTLPESRHILLAEELLAIANMVAPDFTYVASLKFDILRLTGFNGHYTWPHLYKQNTGIDQWTQLCQRNRKLSTKLHRSLPGVFPSNSIKGYLFRWITYNMLPEDCDTLTEGNFTPEQIHAFMKAALLRSIEKAAETSSSTLNATTDDEANNVLGNKRDEPLCILTPEEYPWESSLEDGVVFLDTMQPNDIFNEGAEQSSLPSIKPSASNKPCKRKASEELPGATPKSARTEKGNEHKLL